MSLGTRYKKIFEQEVITPYEGDLWGRQQLGERLTSFVEAVKDGMTIALDAEWGSGKTWFVKNWKAELESKGFKVIYIDAFQHDFMEDPFLLLSMEILNTVDVDDSIKKKFKETIFKSYQAILPHLPMLIFHLAVTLMGGGYVSQKLEDTVNVIKDATGSLGEETLKLIEENLKEHLNEMVENYESNKQKLEYFQISLKEMVKDLDKPLVFIIDELDRCKPEFSIKLIERIKHFFDIPNIVFVLSTNKTQLCESINSYYGFISSNSYLEKFIDLNIKFPQKDAINYRVIIENYRVKFGLELNSHDFSILSTVLKLNSRDLVRVLQKMAFLDLRIHDITPVIAFLYLAYEQKAMSPNKMTENEFLEFFVKSLRDYVEYLPRFGTVQYDFNNLENFANQYANSYQSTSRGIPYLLKYFYVCNTTDELNNVYAAIKRDKQVFSVIHQSNTDNFVQSWHDYINSGFIM